MNYDLQSTEVAAIASLYSQTDKIALVRDRSGDIWLSVGGCPLRRCTYQSSDERFAALIATGTFGYMCELKSDGACKVAFRPTLGDDVVITWRAGDCKIVLDTVQKRQSLLSVFTAAPELADNQLVLADNGGWGVFTRQPNGLLSLYAKAVNGEGEVRVRGCDLRWCETRDIFSFAGGPQDMFINSTVDQSAAALLKEWLGPDTYNGGLWTDQSVASVSTVL